MKRLQTRAAAAALSALLLASPACALAAETAPLTLNTQQDATVQASRKDLGQLENFGHRRAYRGVSASDQWLYQARLGGLSVRLCLFTPEGGGVTFQENLCAAQTRPSPSSAKTAFGGRSRNNSNRTFARFPHRLGTGVFFCFALCLFQKWGTIGVSKSAGRFIV